MSNEPSSLNSIRIEIDGEGTTLYKSIGRIDWPNIPAFAVLTGVNGSGKTQLLELLAYKLTETSHPALGDLRGIRVNVTGDSFGADSVAFVPNQWHTSGEPVLSLAEMQSLKQQLYGSLNERNTRGDLRQRRRRERVRKSMGGKGPEGMNEETFVRMLPEDFSFMLDEVDVTGGLAHVFLSYRVRMAEHRELGMSDSELSSKLGPAPWDVLNETFNAAGFPFRVPSPLGSKILDPYAVRLTDIERNVTLRPSDLSSGEKTIFGVVMWLYNSSHHGVFPKLFLLDEPDAHLHPSLTQQFITVTNDVLCRRYGVRVILTTHSPSTVALAPEGSLFEMRKTNPRIVPSKSRAETIGLLTAGLVVVSQGIRCVLAEDEDDVAFYEMVRDVLTDSGPMRDPKAIDAAPTLTFIRASVGDGQNKIAGGESVVRGWLAKLDVAPLSEVFRGVIDRDSRNVAGPRLAVLGRYSIENYYVDPFVVFAALSDIGKAPIISSVTLSQGQEHLIRSLSSPQLQAIVNSIGGQAVGQLGQLSDDEKVSTPVAFTNGHIIQYPKWMIDRRGHDLLVAYQNAFEGPRVLTRPRLSSAFRRLRLIPTELPELMRFLQS